MPRQKQPYILRKRKDSGYYQVKLPGWKTYKSLGTTRRSEAQVELQKILDREKTRTQIVRIPVKLKELAAGFFDQDSPWVRRRRQAGFSFSPAVGATRTSHVEHYIVPAFGERYPHEIEAHELEDWLFDLADFRSGEPLAGGTRNDIYNTLNILFRELKRQKLVVANPMDDVARLANRYRRRDAFTLQEIKALFPKEREKLVKVWGTYYWATLFYLALTAGLRSGEIRALLWRHVVWDLKGLLILQAVKASGKIESILKMGDEQSPDHRSVLLPKRTLEMLEAWHAETPFPEDDALIFYGDGSGKTINKTTISAHFREALEAKGFDRSKRNLVFHSLRHTYNTRMRNVLSEAMLHYMMGHKRRAMTERYDQGKPEERLKEFRLQGKKVDATWS